MADGNGHNEDNQKVKDCPFGNECDKCSLYIDLTRNVGGVQQKFKACAFGAMVVILSEINQKMATNAQKIELPKGLFKG